MKGGKKEPREFYREFCRTSGNVWSVWDTMQNFICMSYHKQGSWPSWVLKSFSEQKCFRAMNFAITETYLDHVPLSAHKQELPPPCWGCCLWSSVTRLKIYLLRINLDLRSTMPLLLLKCPVMSSIVPSLFNASQPKEAPWERTNYALILSPSCRSEPVNGSDPAPSGLPVRCSGVSLKEGWE